jgi:SAM-dependent methyltransferase
MVESVETTQSPRLKEWYEGDRYFDAHPTWFIHEAPWKAREVLRMLQRHDIRPTSVIDIGCGVGGVLVELSRLLPPGVIFEGYDVAPAAIQIARQYESELISFSTMDALDVNGPTADLFMVLDVIDLLENPLEFLRSIRPKAKHKVFHLSLGLSVQRMVRPGSLLERRQQGEINYFTKETALALFEDAGYSIKDYFYTDMALDLNDARGRLRDGSGDQPTVHWKNFLLRSPRRLLARVSPDWSARLLGGYHLMVLAE